MNKSQLIEATAKKLNMKKKDAEVVISAFIDELEEQLINGEKVQIVGFGTFELKERDAHVGRNPATGETIQVKKSRRAVFTAGKSFKGILNK